MYQAFEAVCRAGQIVPLEPVRFEENEHLVIVRMPAAASVIAAPAPPSDWAHFFGALRDSPHWNEDAVAIQEGLRREWD